MLTGDQVLVFNWIAGSSQVQLFKTELGCSRFESKSNYNCFFFSNAFFAAFVLCIGFVIIKLKIEDQTIYKKTLSRKVTKLKSKFNLIVSWPNRATGAPLLGWPKSIYYFGLGSTKESTMGLHSGKWKTKHRNTGVCLYFLGIFA